MITSIITIMLSAIAPASGPATSATQPATSAATRAASRPVPVTYSDATRIYEGELRKASEEYRAARIAAMRAYTADLSALIKNAVRTADLERANEAKATHDRVNDELKALRDGQDPHEQTPARLKTSPKMPIGIWDVKYASGAHRIYRIKSDGSVAELTPPVEESGRLRVENGELLLAVSGERKVERLTLAGDRLFIEHFDPATRLADDEPTTIGIGRRRP